MTKVSIHRSIAHLKDISLFYRDTKTKGEAIVCLHGRWGRGETWVDFIQNYGEKYRIIAPDQRGHGLSDKPDTKYTTEEMADDIIQLLYFLELKQVILVGHSMGGHIASYITAAYPKLVKGLAILDKSSTMLDNQENNDELVDPITKDWPLPFSSLSEAQDYIKKVDESELSYQYFMNSLIETVEGYTMMFSPQAMAKNIATYTDWSKLLSKLQCPVMLLRAKGSGAVTDEDFEMMRLNIPNCSAHEILNSDHNVHLAKKSLFYQYFNQFLNAI